MNHDLNNDLLLRPDSNKDATAKILYGKYLSVWEEETRVGVAVCIHHKP